MFQIPRSRAKLLRSVLRSTVLEQQPRGEWPLLLCQGTPHGTRFLAQKGEMAVCLFESGLPTEGAIAFRSSVLAAFEGSSQDPVVLSQVSFGHSKAGWAEKGETRTLDLETVTPDTLPPFPQLPTKLTPMPPNFRGALGEASLVAGKESTRYALSLLQIRGRSGQVIATDGRQLLLQGGFRFPWADTFLVPRLPILARDSLWGEETVELGRTESHLCLKLGDWSFFLRVDAKSRYPDADTVIPTAKSVVTRVRLHLEDLIYLKKVWSQLPGRDEEYAPLTLDCRDGVRVRAGSLEKVVEVGLVRSEAEGEPLQAVFNRKYLRKAVELGFSELFLVGNDKPLLCRDSDRVYLWVPIDPAWIVPREKVTERLLSADSPSPAQPPTRTRRSRTMPVKPQGNGPPDPDNGHSSPPPRDLHTLAELVAETELVRKLLHDATGRLLRLQSALKQHQRHNKAFRAAVASLRQLPLED